MRPGTAVHHCLTAIIDGKARLFRESWILMGLQGCRRLTDLRPAWYRSFYDWRPLYEVRTVYFSAIAEMTTGRSWGRRPVNS